MNKKRKKYFIIVILLVIVSVACVAIYLHITNETPFDGITFDTSYEELADKFALQGKKGDEYLYANVNFCGLDGKLQIVTCKEDKVANVNWYFHLMKNKDFDDYKEKINQIIKRINFKICNDAINEKVNKYKWQNDSGSIVYELELKTDYESDGSKRIIVRYNPQ